MNHAAAERRFHPSFWVANGTELFERLAFYGNQAILAIYLNEQLHFSKEQTSHLAGLSGAVVYGMPILAGTLADKMGFRRALMLAYLILTGGYFLLGSVSQGWMQAQGFSLYWLVAGLLILAGIGAGFVKPVVSGTVTRSTNEKSRSTGFSIYYMLVNCGGALGPLLANWVRRRFGFESVFMVGAGACLLMLLVTALFFHVPAESENSGEKKSLGQSLFDLVKVLKNWRFVFFLVVFSVFWMMFFQLFIAMPLYIRAYVDPNADVDRVFFVGPLCIVAGQVLVNHLWKKLPTTRVILIGFVIASFSMLLVGAYPSMWLVVAALIVFSIGEMTQAPRFYEYVSLLAPPGQTGLFMGYAFAPIALGSILAGAVGGPLIRYFGETLHRPALMWTVLFLTGLFACLLMALFNRFAGSAKAQN